MAYIARANCRALRGEHAAAIDDLTAALRCEGIHPADLYYFRAIEHRLLGHYDAAIADLTVAIAMDPRDARFYAERRLLPRQRRRGERGEGLGSGASPGLGRKKDHARQGRVNRAVGHALA